MKRIKIIKSYIVMLLVFMMLFESGTVVKAETASAVSVGTINYELLTLQVYNHNNSIVYYSVDNSNWSEVEGAYSSTTQSYTMDISWISATSDVTIYFKGDSNKIVKSVTLPMKNSAFDISYDKAEGTFTFNNAEESNVFEWRKSTDYNWKTVDIDDTSSSYQSFMKTVDKFRVNGATIIIRLPQVIGTGSNDTGMRPSNEVTITIGARAAAPSVKVNPSKLTLSTTSAMEYYDSSSDLWIECTGTMSIVEITPEVLYDNGAKSMTVKLRKAATDSAPCSKIQSLKIPAQSAPPTIGDSSAETTYYYMNSKLILQFNKAAASKPYEYTIVKEDDNFDVTTAVWKSVVSSNIITISSASSPDGSTVYVRRKGAEATSKTDLVLASAVNSFTVEY